MLEFNATLVAVVLNFIILMYVLNYFLYKPVRGMIEERRSYIERSISDAEAGKRAAADQLEKARQSVSRANDEAVKIIETAAAASEKIKNDELEGTRLEIESMRKTAAEEIEQYKAEARRQMMKETASLSVLIAEKILKKNLDMKAQKGIIDDFIRTVSN